MYTPRSIRNGGVSPRRPSTASSTRSFDPTGRLRATAKLAGKTVSHLVKNALKVHPPQEIHREEAAPPPEFKRTIVRKIEVPYTRKVKVPVRTTKLVPTRTRQRVKVKKLVEVPGFKEVQEKYDVTLERPVEREREVWVKKIVKETVMEPYTVTKTRMKKVPCSVIKEVDDYVDVDVETNKAVQVDGYRVDEVQDKKLVELEEEEVMTYKPVKKDHRIVTHRELGRAPKTQRGHLARKMGTQTFHPHEVDADSDSDPDDVDIQPAKPLASRIGFTLRQTSGADQGRLPPVVARVEPRGPAAKAGIQSGDRIVGVRNEEVSTLNSFRQRVSNTEGPVELSIMRGGRVISTTVRRKKRY